jgi:putative FmdB family regulatory protein
MPIFEYNCEQCGKEFEALVRGQEQPACPHCGSAKLSRLFSVPAAPVVGGGGAKSEPWAGPCGRGGCGRPECD